MNDEEIEDTSMNSTNDQEENTSEMDNKEKMAEDKKVQDEGTEISGNENTTENKSSKDNTVEIIEEPKGPNTMMPEEKETTTTNKIIVAIGYICALFIPIIGFILGIVLIYLKEPPIYKKHGAYIILVALIVWVLTAIMMSI